MLKCILKTAAALILTAALSGCSRGVPESGTEQSLSEDTFALLSDNFAINVPVVPAEK